MGIELTFQYSNPQDVKQSILRARKSFIFDLLDTVLYSKRKKIKCVVDTGNDKIVFNLVMCPLSRTSTHCGYLYDIITSKERKKWFLVLVNSTIQLRLTPTSASIHERDLIIAQTTVSITFGEQLDIQDAVGGWGHSFKIKNKKTLKKLHFKILAAISASS